MTPNDIMRLNYQHLLYFWAVVRGGSLARASEELRLSAPTISTQGCVLVTSLISKYSIDLIQLP